MKEKQGKWSPARVFQAIGQIGYRPVSALLDICDNSVSAGASQISVHIGAQKRAVNGGTRTVVSQFLIADNGSGMDEDGIDNALSLGSSTEDYAPGTLSKFGMGLKSASSSLGRELTVLSKKKGAGILKAVLDQDAIPPNDNAYCYQFGAAGDDDADQFNELTGNAASGTVILIKKIHDDRLPSISEIRDQLANEAGVVYYYYMKGKVPEAPPLSICIEGNEIGAVDPLFVDEIDPGNGNLDETTWDGCSVKWITKPFPIDIDIESGCKATVEITQLPHPPSMQYHGKSSQKECRDRYLIGAGNYGFYIYRNGRLISWANSLDLVSFDQDLYSFRGRLNLTSAADNALNIDVTKSRIHLSEVARVQLTPVLTEAKKKSILAWKNAGGEISRLQATDPHDTINQELDKVGDLAEKNDLVDEQVASKEEKSNLESRRKKAAEKKPASDEEKKKLIETGQRVQYVATLPNNQLWERAHDPEHGLIVRVNQSHRLMRDIVSSLPMNGQLTQVLDLLFFGLARGEYGVIYKSALSEQTCEDILEEYRERVSAELSEIIKKIEINTIVK